MHRRARSCRGSRSRTSAPPSARAARRSTRSARPWSRPRAPAPPTTSTRGSRERRRRSAPVEVLGLQCPIPLSEYPQVTLAHGGGGRLTHALIERMFLAAFRNPALEPLHDGAVLEVPAGRLALTTDSFVVSPLFFPGGDIGSLAVHGTVNDLAMCGAQPLALTAGFMLEEGLPMDDLWRIVRSMAQAARDAGVRIVTGDTKVVDRGKGDGVFINTTGIGLVPEGVHIAPDARAARGPAAAERAHRRPRHRHHVGARGARVRDHDRERLGRPERARRRAARRARRARPRAARSHARRRGERAQRDRRVRAGRAAPRGARDPAGRAGARRLRDPRARPALRRERGQVPRDRRARRRRSRRSR